MEPSGGTPDSNLPDEFWASRPYLEQIRQAAWSRSLSPDGVLGAVLARYATAIPTTIMLPAVVGSMATFDYNSILVARSGGGKTTSMACARDLLYGMPDHRIMYDPPIGSGEGLIQAFLEVELVEIDGKKVQRQVQILDGLHIGVDEASVLGAQMKREGTTIAQTLCSAWVGAPLGQLNAKAETRRIIPSYHARVTSVMGIQTARGEFLVSGPTAEMGLTQRMVFFSLNDPSLPYDPPDWPGELDLPYINPLHNTMRAPISVDKSIQEEVRTYRHGIVTGTTKEDPLDSHMYLAQLKTAGIFAFMSGRRNIDPSDWELASTVMSVSRNVRSTILTEAQASRRATADAQADRAAHVAVRVEDTLMQGAVVRGAKAIARKARRLEVPLTRKDATHAVSGEDRKKATIDEMLSYAVVKGWLATEGDTHVLGDSFPL